MMDKNEQRQTVRIDPVRALAMHAALGIGGPAPQPGRDLPKFWHWSQFWMIERPENLGRDGHPKVGGFIPDLGLPRRMWAGGEIEFQSPLVIGDAAERASRISGITRKDGRSGPLAFVTVTHDIFSDGLLTIRERQDLVYMNDPTPSAVRPRTEPAPRNEDVLVKHAVTTTDLFRYSALTFNGHRIHYDIDYARDVEGYPGLVIHGPLLAQRLIELAERELGGLRRFSFRAKSPLFHFEGFEACATRNGSMLDLWIRADDGRLAMTAQATI